MNNSKKRAPATPESSGLSLAQLQIEAERELRRRHQRRAEKLQATIEGWAKDFIGFAKCLKVPSKAGGLIYIVPSVICLAFESARTGRDYVLKARQVYMTTWELARDIWFFLTRKDVQVVILCQSDKENTAVKQISARLQTMFESLVEKFPSIPVEKRSDTHWVRTDGDKSELWIVGAGATEKSASKKGRSGTVHRLHVTEVAFFEYADDTLTSVLKCVPPKKFNTEITFESTPNGAVGYFHDNYKAARDGAKNGFKAHFYPWFLQEEYQLDLEDEEKIEPQTERERELVNVHKVTQQQLKWYRQEVALSGQAKTNQEYPTDSYTCWLYEGRVFFDPDSLLRLKQIARDPIALDHKSSLGGRFRQWVAPKQGHSYIVGVDPSNGVGGDPCCAVVLDKTTGEHCATLHGQFNADDFALAVAAIGWAYNRAVVVVERSASCDLIFSTFQKWKRPGDLGTGYPNVYVGEGKKFGFWMTHTSRPKILDMLEEAIRKSLLKALDENGEEVVLAGFKTYDEKFITEAQNFIVREEKPQAAPGEHDDLVMAMALAYSQTGLAEGLRHTLFAQPPSISYTHTPVAFDGIQTSASIDEIVEREKAKWAGGSAGSDAGLGMAAIISSPADLEGF